MTLAARVHYHKELWPAACEVCDWSPSDKERRHAVVLECMRLVRGPLVTTSDPQFGAAETTALFTFLRHLADPASLEQSALWVECQKDYRTFNKARQADWHETKIYGRTGAKKLQRDRFGGAKTAAGGPLDSLDPKAVSDRLLTMQARRRAKAKCDTLSAAGGQPPSQPLTGGSNHAPDQKAGYDTHNAGSPESEKGTAGRVAIADLSDLPF